MLTNYHEAIGQNLAIIPQMAQQLLEETDFTSLNLDHLVSQKKGGMMKGDMMNIDGVNMTMVKNCMWQKMNNNATQKCENFLKKVDERAKAQIDENFGDLVYAHVPLSVFTGVFTWIFWPIKFFAYLFDPNSVRSA